MKKSSIIIIASLLALIAISVFVYKTKHKSSTIDKDASDFGFKDTASIDKLFLADKNGKTILLERKPEGWLVNSKFPARPDVIELLLYTIRMVEVRSPVSKTSRNNVIKVMATKSTKIEIYSKGKKIKQYYVGHTTQDHAGTYMLLTNLDTDENYAEPFITHIPGFEGFLTTRYNTNELEWRDRLIINYRPPQIKQIKLELHEMPDSSFVIDLFSMQRFGLKTLSGKSIPFEEDKIKQFIAYFQNVNGEIVMNKSDKIIDSLSTSGVPFAALTITDRNDQKGMTYFYHKQSSTAQNEKYGVAYHYDPDRLFVKYNQDKDYALAQFYVFGKILQTYAYFMPRK